MELICVRSKFFPDCLKGGGVFFIKRSCYESSGEDGRNCKNIFYLPTGILKNIFLSFCWNQTFSEENGDPL